MDRRGINRISAFVPILLSAIVLALVVGKAAFKWLKAPYLV